MALTSCARDPAPPPAATAAGAPSAYLDYSGKDDALTGGVKMKVWLTDAMALSSP